MKKESAYITKFKKYLKFNDNKKVKELLKKYMQTSYANKDGYCHLSANILSYEVKEIDYWNMISPTTFYIHPGDKKRELVYVYTDDGKRYKISSRSIKKYIRNHKNIFKQIFD